MRRLTVVVHQTVAAPSDRGLPRRRRPHRRRRPTRAPATTSPTTTSRPPWPDQGRPSALAAPRAGNPGPAAGPEDALASTPQPGHLPAPSMRRKNIHLLLKAGNIPGEDRLRPLLCSPPKVTTINGRRQDRSEEPLQSPMLVRPLCLDLSGDGASSTKTSCQKEGPQQPGQPPSLAVPRPGPSGHCRDPTQCPPHRSKVCVVDESWDKFEESIGER